MSACLRWLVIFAALLALAFAPAPFPRAERRGKAPVSDMEGLWQGPHKMLITPTRMTFLSGARNDYELRIDHNAHPKTFDIKGVPGNGAEGNVYKGIYRIEGDTLTVSYGHGDSRPRALNDGGITQVYKRVPR
jgi:uncharacterized protein (TIGR03067 family)